MIDDDNYSLESSVGYQLGLASRMHERRLDDRLRKVGISRVNFTVLVAVAKQGLSTPSEIADYLRSEKSAISRSIGLLKRQGYLIEGTAENDKRMRILAATPAGRAKLEEGVAAAVAERQRIQHAFDDNELLLFADFLRRISEIDRFRGLRI